MINKYDIAKILDKIGILLDLKGESSFKVRAYHDAARALENISIKKSTSILKVI